MSTEFVSPVGRLVQGGVTLETKQDMDGKPALDKDTGQPIKECFMALAVRKDDPGVPAFYALFVAAARADFPHLFDAQGNCTHPKFAWKIQDGDGVDTNGASVAAKPGFAGHWIFKMGTRYLPKCFHAGKYDPMQQIQNPQEVIKRGYFVRIAGTIRGNGVTPQERQAVPGLFVSPNLVELIAFGEEIVGGMDANKTFGAAPAVAALPPGASATPLASAAVPGAPAGLTPPPLPGATALPPVAGPGPSLPAPAGPGPAMIGAPPLPPAVAGPSYVMQPSAMGATREALNAQGWTDDLLIQHGHMIRVG